MDADLPPCRHSFQELANSPKPTSCAETAACAVQHIHDRAVTKAPFHSQHFDQVIEKVPVRMTVVGEDFSQKLQSRRSCPKAGSNNPVGPDCLGDYVITA